MSNNHIDNNDKSANASPVIEQQKVQHTPIKCDKTMLEKLQEQMKSNQIK